MNWQKVVKKLEKALDSLIDVEVEMNQLEHGNTCQEAICRIRSLICWAEEVED